MKSHPRFRNRKALWGDSGRSLQGRECSSGETPASERKPHRDIFSPALKSVLLFPDGAGVPWCLEQPCRQCYVGWVWVLPGPPGTATQGCVLGPRGARWTCLWMESGFWRDMLYAALFPGPKHPITAALTLKSEGSSPSSQHSVWCRIHRQTRWGEGLQ